MNFDFIYGQMVGILHCNICLINDQGDIEKIYGDISEKQNPLLTDESFRLQLLQRQRLDYPDIFHEQDSILYALISLDTGTLIAGPVSIELPTREMNDFIARTHHIGKKQKYRLPYCEMKVFGSGILMLYHLLSDKEMSLPELWKHNEIDPDDIVAAHTSILNVMFDRHEQAMPHNPYDQEVREMDSIRKGDVEMLRQSLQETYHGEVGRLSTNDLRQAKNIAICVITLASRAAIEGGLLPEVSFSMVDGYVLEIEKMSNIAKIDATMRQVEFRYAKEVARIRGKQQKNQLVEQAKNYIFQNLHSNLTLNDIGKQIGANASYLSTLFRKVEGITIQLYIRNEKIRMAENMLRYSEHDVGDIANYLSFSSQSYFGRVFKEQTGMTPAQYRKQFGVKNK